MSRFNIRRLERSDVAAFRDVRLEGLERHPEAFGASYEDELAHSASQISDRIANNCIFGGFTDADALAGVIAIARMKGAKTHHIASIWGMYIRPEARGSGLSRQLMHAALDEATACRSIRLCVVSSNHAAIRLYESFGFKEWAKDSEALKVGDVYHDEILMRLDTGA
ncbi:GNAT family N-acetyltransferase [Rhizobium sp. P38BS-XIX]|uniref:GNAT family N-acetyltransferase n=1 Tax=Rhizobium sp. P38BS-XIX TaxID=2726740 RepID=UPI0014569AD8|nr:GNAT family N-acetyltransferase [Rhizobium sp. P38BS-XIX]NLR96106.1 GNAT family N-acetyltransferase [Rhizobium sp. P38BS-XIX]